VSSNSENPKWCPVRLTRLYLRRLGEDYVRGDSDNFLIPRTKKGKDGQLTTDGTRTLSYTTAMEDLRSLLAKLGHDSSKYTEHSGKRGGATTAAERGMTENELQRFGAWRSQGMAAKYTNLSLEKRLKMSDLLL
jgi:hypothetical protein